MNGLYISRIMLRAVISACLAMVAADCDDPALGQAPTPTVPAAPAPAAQPAAPSYKLYMPDGQLKSHLVRIYVTHQILPDYKPVLKLLRGHVITKQAIDESLGEQPAVVAPKQEWIATVDGQQVQGAGTLLLFDLSNVEFQYKAMMRGLPVVTWTEGDAPQLAVGSRAVNVGNMPAAMGWTVLIVSVALLLIILLSWRVAGNPLRLLTGVDGHLSLSQTQIACWTVAIASVVLLYGLIKLEIPNIPESLVVLLGASLATGGIGYYRDATNQQNMLKRAIEDHAAAAPGVAAAAPNVAVANLAARPLRLGDLVRELPSTEPEPELSLAKAQMLFWTLILLVIFLFKSILDGVIWDVPWQLVALMGFSQAGYVLPKVTPPPAAP